MEVQVTTSESILADKLKNETLLYVKAEEIIDQLKRENEQLKQENLKLHEKLNTEPVESEQEESEVRPFSE